MSSPIHLTSEQASKYLVEVDWHRQRYERVYQRVVALGYGENHPFRRNVRAVLIALRALCYDVNDMTQKGSSRAYLRRARNWPTI
jgi:hypothetical protein